MKILIYCVLISSCVFIFSCKKEESGKGPSVPLNIENISAKWVISGNNSYKSIEFDNKGNYMIVENSDLKTVTSDIVIKGLYQILDTANINLSNFGKLEISYLSANALDFKLIISGNPNTLIEGNATKSELFANSAKTDLLCRSWSLISIGGIPITDYQIYFSKAGTYYVESGVKYALGNWQWCNAEQNKLSFTIVNNLDCNSNKVIKDLVLTTDTFKGITMENAYPYDIIMVPLENVELNTKVKSNRALYDMKLFDFTLGK